MNERLTSPRKEQKINGKQGFSILETGRRVKDWRQKHKVRQSAAKLFAITAAQGGQVFDGARLSVSADQQLGSGSDASTRRISVSEEGLYGSRVDELNVTLTYDGVSGDLRAIRADAWMIEEDDGGLSGRRFQTGGYDSTRRDSAEGLHLKTIARGLSRAVKLVQPLPVPLTLDVIT